MLDVKKEEKAAPQKKRHPLMIWNERMLHLRLVHQLTQEEIARILDISQVAYGMYEMGKRRISVEKLVALARFYHVSLDYLVGMESCQNR